MATVGLKQFRDHITRYILLVRSGQRVVITYRGTPIAELMPPSSLVARVVALVGQGKARWEGGKPRGAKRPPKPRRGLVADAVLEDRR